ncbi:YciI family protein [Kibdelosporangium persicum]|uniref:Dehydrogenase n=1 Tax=Kibdelosporangium persicum TaxID=2698649 RepID=A0ABX2FAF6_9PSEU|nr:YciI family protein [Kibdelosporangium persicum]NRN68114.1 Dehydrogenase [Kibdelosporangium persicum]
MIIIKSDEETEAGRVPSEDEFAEMARFNQEMADAGVLLAAEGLLDSHKGARVRLSGGNTTITDGPFTESKELVAGFWIIRADSLEEAIDWASRVPSPPDVETNLEVRQVAEAFEDYAETYTEELKQGEDKLREQMAENQ